MALWHFRVVHQNQISTTGHKEFDAPSHGPLEVLKVPCECGHDHNLVGMRAMGGNMSGHGNGSVVPGNDPHVPPSPKEDEVPSWSGSPTNIDETNPGY
jgi:hypothetical protein